MRFLASFKYWFGQKWILTAIPIVAVNFRWLGNIVNYAQDISSTDIHESYTRQNKEIWSFPTFGIVCKHSHLGTLTRERGQTRTWRPLCCACASCELCCLSAYLFHNQPFARSPLRWLATNLFPFILIKTDFELVDFEMLPIFLVKLWKLQDILIYI